MSSTDTGMFCPQLALRPSRLFAGVLCGLVVAACIGAVVSNLPLPMKIVLFCAVFLLSWRMWWQEQHAGLRRIVADRSDPQQFTLQFADGRAQRVVYAGYAQLGTVAIFVFIERGGWKRIFGARRFTVLRDATSEEDFRRFRTWVRVS